MIGLDTSTLPCNSTHLEIADGAQHDLCVEVVRDGGHVLALDRQLLVEQRQVELQLLMPFA